MGEGKGRGRLSSIDLLPDEAFPHVREAIEQLKARKLPQETIRETLNQHLLALGLDPVSRAAFNRYSLSLAIQGDRIMRAREIASIFAEKMSDAPTDDIGLLINETIKTLVYDIITAMTLDDEAASMKQLKEAALTLQRLEQAKVHKVAGDVKRKEKLVNDAAEAATVAAKAAGLSEETAEAIKAKILGIARDG